MWTTRWCSKPASKKISSEQQLCGGKCLDDCQRSEVRTDRGLQNSISGYLVYERVNAPTRPKALRPFDLLGRKRKQLPVVIAAGFSRAQFTCSRLIVTLKCLWSIPCPVSSGADTSSATKLISVKTLVCRCVFLPAADKPGWRSCSVFSHTWSTVSNSRTFKCGQISHARGNKTQMHGSRGVL